MALSRINNPYLQVSSAGSAASPALTTSSDTNTGIFFPAADTIGFAEGGTEVMRIDSSGNVGIGTTSPSTFGKFAVQGNAAAGTVVSAIVNQSGTANSQAVLSFDPGANGFNIRDSQIRATNNGSNQTSLEFYTSNAATPAEAMRITFAGNVGIATTAPEHRLDVTAPDNVTTTTAVSVQNSARNYGLGLGAYTLTNRNIGGATTNIDYTFDIGGASIFKTADTERMRIDSSGNVLVTSAAKLGYGTGSGGTVTQATSKSTGVTLDKPTGQITMNAASLAAAAEVSFTLTNSVIAATDVVVVSIASGATAGAYSVQCDATAAGSCRIGVGNRSTGSLSETLVLNFAIIKGATS